MLHETPIFAELFGFAIFDVKQLAAFQQKHRLGQDLLAAFTTTDLGTQVSAEGVCIPITGITGEYYHFASCRLPFDNQYLTGDQIVVRSPGWILESVSGEVIICGIGYLKQFPESLQLHSDKFIRISMDTGWNEVTIVGGSDNANRLVYEICSKHVSHPPLFSGDFENSLNLID